MQQESRAGTVHWIDHYVVGTNDQPRWLDFHTNLLGAQLMPRGQQPMGEHRARRNAFQKLAGCHHGGFLEEMQLPPTLGLGRGTPRYGFFVRREDLDQHLRRLDRHQVPHTDPRQTSEEGQEGTVVYFEDPDGNEFEFWAPVEMPAGAMEVAGELGIGRISHGVFECRDLDRTADFFMRYCGIDPIRSADIPKDTLSLGLAGGGRIIYKQVDVLGTRTGGRGTFAALHTALVVREEDYLPNLRRMWAELPEWEYDSKAPLGVDPETLPARTGAHGSTAGQRWKALYGRGDDWYDWDTLNFHFIGGTPQGGSMANYVGHSTEYYLEQLEGAAPF